MAAEDTTGSWSPEGGNCSQVTPGLQRRLESARIAQAEGKLVIQIHEYNLRKDFKAVGNGMIVTKPGSAGTSDVTHDVTRMKYQHPSTPALGNQLNDQPMDFKTMKLTHYSNSKNGHILLHALYKYVSEVLIASVPQQNHGEKEQFHYQFPVTAFIAVSSYLSPQESALKLQHNQFAQWFKNPPQLNNSPLALVNPGPTTIPPLPVPPLIPHHNNPRFNNRVMMKKKEDEEEGSHETLQSNTTESPSTPIYASSPKRA
ncbi:T-box transcription factor TBX5-A-like [Dysidea avara]|uniref:T-box transcription factor TBX5-A-like n=1 Tax=Dysidea avara TaxID=196820 RepID=UPI0033292870